jgi:nucleotide-binding universal stress UspA family protein
MGTITKGGVHSSGNELPGILRQFIVIKEGEDKEGAWHDLMKKARDGLRDLLRDSGIESTARIEEGELYKRILSFCSESGIDLIVMGARGSSLIKGMLMGSVADAILRSASCPVLMVL